MHGMLYIQRLSFVSVQICALDGTMALIIQRQHIISILEDKRVCVADKSDDHKQLVFPEMMLIV